MKFQWPKDTEGVKDISTQELRWLLEGLSLEQPKAHKKIKLNGEDSKCPYCASEMTPIGKKIVRTEYVYY